MMRGEETTPRRMEVLELEPEDEMDSLIRETADHDGLLSPLRFRAHAHRNAAKNEDHRPLVMGWLRSSGVHVYTSHRVRCFGILILVGVLIPLLVVNVFFLDIPDPIDKFAPHPITYGDAKNAQCGYAGEETKAFSVAKQNRHNLQGHFWHDPYVSPYSSDIYLLNERHPEHKAEAQKEFDAERLRVMQEFGSYEPPEHPNVYQYNFKGGDVTEFPPDAWQVHANYVNDWLEQAHALVQRVQEGIYQEYGYKISPTNNKSAKALRTERFRVIVQDDLRLVNGVAVNEAGQQLPGVAYMSPEVWEALVRKLLHAMMTHDDFFVVAVGPSAALYEGNNFFQSHIHQFHYLLEPVFDRLGVQLISRNMGMKASTTISALGGKSIYGEYDILWYTGEVESDERMDLLYRQSIMSGKKVPIILTPVPTSINGAWIGNLQPGENICEMTSLRRDGITALPETKACKFVRCTEQAASLCNAKEQYRSKCWEPRSDWNPDSNEDTRQEDGLPITSGSLNFAQHKFESRKLAMLVLHALEEALKRWAEQAVNDAVPLDSSLWHMQETYDKVRENAESASGSPCESLVKNLIPSLCRVPMRALTEWTPRVDPELNRLKSQVEGHLFDPRKSYVPLYGNDVSRCYLDVDLRPLDWKDDDDDHVHMIAIATNSSVKRKDFMPAIKEGKDSFESDSQDDTEIIDLEPSRDSDDERRLTYMFARNSSLRSSSRPSTRFTKIIAAKESWTLHEAPIGFCDGSAQSTCHRATGNTCLLANHNHYQSGILGHGDSGWMYINLPKMLFAIVLVRFQWDQPWASARYTLSEDFTFDFSIDGKVSSMSRKEFGTNAVELTSDMAVHLLLEEMPLNDDENIGKDNEEAKKGSNASEERDIRLGLRIRSDKHPQTSKVLLTHVYFA